MAPKKQAVAKKAETKAPAKSEQAKAPAKAAAKAPAKAAESKALKARKIVKRGTNLKRVRKIHTTVRFRRPVTLSLKRAPKYQRKSVPHRNRYISEKLFQNFKKTKRANLIWQLMTWDYLSIYMMTLIYITSDYLMTICVFVLSDNSNIYFTALLSMEFDLNFSLKFHFLHCRMDHFAIIKYPLTTESAMKKIEDHNTLVFITHLRANKPQIKSAVKKLYNVEVASVNTLIRPDGEKKAYVKLTSDHDAIETANQINII